MPIPLTPHQLFDEWKTGDAVSVGRQLMEHLDRNAQVSRAGDVLDFCMKRHRPIREIEAVRSLALNPACWNQGHKAFDAVRHLTLIEEKTPTSLKYLSLLLVAEITAKLIYNATDPMDPFDEDTAWWLASVAKDMVTEVGDVAFESEIWRRLTAQVH